MATCNGKLTEEQLWLTVMGPGPIIFVGTRMVCCRGVNISFKFHGGLVLARLSPGW